MHGSGKRGAATAADAIIALALFGCIPVLVKSISANPFTIGILRLAVASAGVLALTTFRRELRRIPLIDLLRLALIGALFFGHWLAYFYSVKLSTASIGAIGLSTYGVDLLILGAIFNRGRIHPTDILAVILAAAGAVIVVPEFRMNNAIATGMALGSISAVMYATLPILHQRWSHLPTAIRALGQFGFAFAFFLLFLPKSSWAGLSGRDWSGLIFLAIGPTLIGHSLWVRVTTRLSPALTSIIYYGNVPVAVGLGVLLLHEPLTARTLTGALMIVGGGIFGLAMQWRRSRRQAGSAAPSAA